MKIEYNTRFLLKDLQTNELQIFKLVPYTETYKPIWTGESKQRQGYDKEITSNGGEIFSDGTIIITNNSPIGKSAYGRITNEKISILLPNGESAIHLILAVGDAEIKNYNSRTINTLAEFNKNQASNKKEKTIINNPNATKLQEGIEWYKESRILKTIAIVRAPEWTEDYCFVIEKLSVTDFQVYLLGKTYKKGNLYYSDAKYLSNKKFVLYQNIDKEKIITAYSIQHKLKVDPIENNPDYKDILESVDALVMNKIGFQYYTGFCHKYWEYKKQYLKRYFDINWKSPAELNPDTCFD